MLELPAGNLLWIFELVTCLALLSCYAMAFGRWLVSSRNDLMSQLVRNSLSQKKCGCENIVIYVDTAVL